jgi:hypothetical protein
MIFVFTSYIYNEIMQDHARSRLSELWLNFFLVEYLGGHKSCLMRYAAWS